MPETKPKREEDNHSFSVSVPRLGRRLQPPGHGHAGCRRRLSPRPDAVPLPLCTDTAAFSRGVTAAMVSLHALRLCHWGNLVQGRSENNWQQIYCETHRFGTGGLQKTVWRKQLRLGNV